jgi:hypothetical protein
MNIDDFIFEEQYSIWRTRSTDVKSVKVHNERHMLLFAYLNIFLVAQRYTAKLQTTDHFLQLFICLTGIVILSTSDICRKRGTVVLGYHYHTNLYGSCTTVVKKICIYAHTHTREIYIYIYIYCVDFWECMLTMSPIFPAANIFFLIEPG